MLRIIRLMTGIMAAALRGVRKRVKSNIACQTSSCCPAPESACSCHPAKPFWPNQGDEVEAWSVHASAWFPAVVVASSDSDNPWAPVLVRLKGNASNVHDKLRRDLVRPLRRLAAARRECGPEVDYSAYDRDNIRHMEECTGCRECSGVGQYYNQCRKCRQTKHRELLDGTRRRSLKCGHETGDDGLCWLCLPTWPYTADTRRMVRCQRCRGSGFITTHDSGVAGAEEYGTCPRCGGAREIDEESTQRSSHRRSSSRPA